MPPKPRKSVVTLNPRRKRVKPIEVLTEETEVSKNTGPIDPTISDMPAYSLQQVDTFRLPPGQTTYNSDDLLPNENDEFKGESNETSEAAENLSPMRVGDVKETVEGKIMKIANKLSKARKGKNYYAEKIKYITSKRKRTADEERKLMDYHHKMLKLEEAEKKVKELEESGAADSAANQIKINKLKTALQNGVKTQADLAYVIGTQYAYPAKGGKTIAENLAKRDLNIQRTNLSQIGMNHNIDNFRTGINKNIELEISKDPKIKRWMEKIDASESIDDRAHYAAKINERKEQISDNVNNQLHKKLESDIHSHIKDKTMGDLQDDFDFNEVRNARLSKQPPAEEFLPEPVDETQQPDDTGEGIIRSTGILENFAKNFHPNVKHFVSKYIEDLRKNPDLDFTKHSSYKALSRYNKNIDSDGIFSKIRDKAKNLWNRRKDIKDKAERAYNKGKDILQKTREGYEKGKDFYDQHLKEHMPEKINTAADKVRQFGDKANEKSKEMEGKADKWRTKVNELYDKIDAHGILLSQGILSGGPNAEFINNVMDRHGPYPKGHFHHMRFANTIRPEHRQFIKNLYNDRLHGVSRSPYKSIIDNSLNPVKSGGAWGKIKNFFKKVGKGVKKVVGVAAKVANNPMIQNLAKKGAEELGVDPSMVDKGTQGLNAVNKVLGNGIGDKFSMHYHHAVGGNPATWSTPYHHDQSNGIVTSDDLVSDRAAQMSNNFNYMQQIKEPESGMIRGKKKK